MSVDTRINHLGALQRELQGDPVLVAALNAAFDDIGFTQSAAEQDLRSNKRKAIKDNVWGMLDFSAHEMRLIDSPLMQRMRGIHQLGCAALADFGRVAASPG